MAVWDCILFNDEVEMLVLRLALLGRVVDRFVVVEADHTHRGVPKTSVFDESRQAFISHEHKIQHVVAEVPGVDGRVAPWDREQIQHQALAVATLEADPDDLLLVGDVDELPFPSVVAELDRSLAVPTRLVMRHAIAYANHELCTPWLGGTKACRARDRDTDEMRVLLGARPGPYLPTMPADPDRNLRRQGGWHLSFLGGTGAVRAKVASSTHDYDLPVVVEGSHLERCARLGVDFLGRYRARVGHGGTDEIQALVARDFPHLIDRRRPRPLAAATFLVWCRWRIGLPPMLVTRLERVPGLPLSLGAVLAPLDVAHRLAARYGMRRRLRSVMGGTGQDD